MSQTLMCLIRILFQISFLVGVFYSRKSRYFVLNSAVFCVTIVWFGACTLRLETDGLVFNNSYLTLKLCVIYWSLFIVNLAVFLPLIDFRIKSKKLSRLISLNYKICKINPHTRGRRKDQYLMNVLGVIGFQLLSGGLLLYWEETTWNVVNKMYDRLCVISITWPTTMLCLQFSCWVQIFTFNFEVVVEKIQNTMTSTKQTNSALLTVSYTLSKLNNELKMVMRLKQAITDSYSSSIIFNQIYTFICLLLNWTLLMHVEFSAGRVKTLRWHRYYFSARIIYYSLLSYIPHFVGQIAFSKVSAIIRGEVYYCFQTFRIF